MPAYASFGMSREAVAVFDQIKQNGFLPDDVSYTSLLNAYGRSQLPEKAREVFDMMKRLCSASENWAKASALFPEMEENDIQPDSIACSALMRAFNKGGQPTKVLVLGEYMRERAIPLNDAVLFEMVSACSILQDWKTTLDLIKLMEPWFPSVSIGLLHQLLHLLGRSGKIESMMKEFLLVQMPKSFGINSTNFMVTRKKNHQR
ncbi:pentatricopeptide repeat-containing protein At2g41720-like [Hibiscus syriacus]|uniref:pentatricopeptide repeat-containing protein At2g41720-like n=1 Tax=Hibiscus syriacus TaxID=106335 RepID=UPI001923D494|nr:pentatricopeptide repeat-containing protein At2g41720-like [Hibiscus syriacus]